MHSHCSSGCDLFSISRQGSLSSKSADETAHPTRSVIGDRPARRSARNGRSALRSWRAGNLCPRLPNDHEQHGARLPNDRPGGHRWLSSELLFAVPPPGFRSSFCSAEETPSFGDRLAGCALFRAPLKPASFHSPVAHRCTGSVAPSISSQSGLPNLILP